MSDIRDREQQLRGSNRVVVEPHALGEFASGFYVYSEPESSRGLGCAYVNSDSVGPLIAWLRKTYPEHFAEASKRESIGTLSAKLELDTGDLKAETAQIADNLERAAAALARIRGER